MAKFNINEYKGRFVMHCKTEEEAQNFCGFLHNVGRKWSDGDLYCHNTEFYDYEENTVYYFNSGKYGYIDYAKEENYIILEWSDYMNKEPADMTLAEVCQTLGKEINIVKG